MTAATAMLEFNLDVTASEIEIDRAVAALVCD
jgi:hypothetical protein